MSIAELLKADEGKTLEFKQNLFSPRNLLKTLVAFANTAGGKIIVDVVDKTRQAIGFEEIGMRLRFNVHLAKPHQIQTRTTEQVEAQVEAQVDLRILQACAETPLSSAEIATVLGHKTLSGNVRRALPALREAGLLEYTIPGKPNSRLQKYRLTENGKQVLEGGK